MKNYKIWQQSSLTRPRRDLVLKRAVRAVANDVVTLNGREET